MGHLASSGFGVLIAVLVGLGLDCTGKSRPLPACVELADAGPPPGSPAVLVGAADIAGCDHLPEAEATAKLLDAIPGTVFTAGDNAYEEASIDNFLDCYHPTWGRHRARTRPSPGNHEYYRPFAGPYFAYFCGANGDAFKGYYSYDLGSWHIISLNSNCDAYESDVHCEAGRDQEQWLRSDLAAHPARCTLAYWHHPRFTSGNHPNATNMGALWQALYEAGAEIVISGHSHNYERFAPQDNSGRADSDRGIREFVVGTGGESLNKMQSVQPNSEVRNDDSHGVLKLTLRDGGYDWEFVPVAGDVFTDSGTGQCH